MNTIELQQLWQGYADKLDQSLSLNQQVLRELQQNKVHRALGGIRPIKYLGIVAGILWVLFMGGVVVTFWSTYWAFLVGAAALSMVMTGVAVGMYIYDLLQIQAVDPGESIVDSQRRIANLQTSLLRSTRLMFLQLPLYTVFHLNPSMLIEPSIPLWTIQILVTVIFTLAAIWFFRNIHLGSIDRKWFRFLFNGKDWTGVHKAKAFLDELEQFESE